MDWERYWPVAIAIAFLAQLAGGWAVNPGRWPALVSRRREPGYYWFSIALQAALLLFAGFIELTFLFPSWFGLEPGPTR